MYVDDSYITSLMIMFWHKSSYKKICILRYSWEQQWNKLENNKFDNTFFSLNFLTTRVFTRLLETSINIFIQFTRKTFSHFIEETLMHACINRTTKVHKKCKLQYLHIYKIAQFTLVVLTTVSYVMTLLTHFFFLVFNARATLLFAP